MRAPSINHDLSFYSFRFVFFWNEYASLSWTEAEPLLWVSRDLSGISTELRTNTPLTPRKRSKSASHGKLFFQLSLSGIKPHQAYTDKVPVGYFMKNL